MFRRLVSAIAALATALSVAWVPQLQAAGSGGMPAWDLCVGGAPVTAERDPAAPAHAHADCDRCCASTAAAPPRVVAGAESPQSTDDEVGAAARVAAPREPLRTPPARAPPRA